MRNTSIYIQGHVGKDLDLRYTAKGDAIANISVAVNQWVKDGDDTTGWYRVTLWKQLAEWNQNHIKKGDLVAVIGTVTIEKWKNNDGEEQTTVNIFADSINKVMKPTKTEAPAPQKKAAEFDDDIPF